MKKHIQKFTIHEYKGIHDLELDQLNAINILTGDNNSGKTSILELISTLSNPRSIREWMLCTRIRSMYLRDRQYFKAFYNMFPIDEDDRRISYSVIDEKGIETVVTVEGTLEDVQMSEKEMYRLNGLRTNSTEREEEIVDTMCLHLDIYINDQKVSEENIYEVQNRFVWVNLRKTSYFVKTKYISPVDHAANALELDSILADKELYKEMIEILQSFDDNIIGVTALKSERDFFSVEYMILTQNHQKALPITAYGDGMKKALLLLSAVVNAKDGILLLDEFETAIHTSAMDAVFSWLLKSAIRLNVQVFLTSHSEEAIQKVLRCSEELQKYINLYTLYDFNGKNYVRMLGCQEAINANDNLGLELR